MADNLLGNNRFNTAQPELPQEASDEIRVPVTDPKDVWKDEKQPWASTTQGRLMIRTFSRGIMGAAFYSVGGYVAAKGLQGYDKDNPNNPIQHLASFFDKFAGRPIEKIFGENAVTFRPTLSTGPRTLGEDVVDTTFNFAAATAGDAIGRNIMGMFDPNCESKWRDENGKFHFPKAVKSVMAATGRVFEAQMADWFVSVPYVYQKRFQRNIIDKFSPGFGYDSDRALNGSSFKLNEAGEITGTYGLEGAIDLQARFTGYNIGTMIYYDAMDAAKSKIKSAMGKDGDNIKLKVPVTPASMYNASKYGVNTAIRYIIKSTIKALFIMTPSVPSFWMMRVAQFKDKSMGIVVGKDAEGNKTASPLLVEGADKFSTIRIHRPTTLSGELATFEDANGHTRTIDNPFDGGFDPYKTTHGIFDTMVNPMARASFALTKKLNNITAKTAETFNWSDKASDTAVDLSSRYVNGAMAYTPYIYTKNEFSERWNNADMDSAIYRALDGVLNFSGKEIKAGFQDIRQALRQQAPDVTSTHPETVPENYDQKHGQFVQKLGDRGPNQNIRFADKISPQASKSANWQEQVASRPDDRQLLSTR
jgi:hypothetical protein